MVISCSVPTCKNRFQKGGEIQFHSFPLRREDMCKRWAEAIGRTEWMPTKNSFVCSQHFTHEDYQIRAGKHKHFLRETAIPSVFKPTMPRRKGAWRSTVGSSPRRLPFILPSHLEVSCSVPIQPPQPMLPTISTLPTSLPSGVSIVPLKKIQPKPDAPYQPVKWGDNITFEYPQIKHNEYQQNGHKRMKTIPHDPLNNVSMTITPKLNKPMPNLNPIRPKIEENDELDVTQFLSISLEKPQDDDYDNLRQKCLHLEKTVQKRENTIRQMNVQLKNLRKKMDSISVHKIIQDNFNGLTYDILNCYLNNTNLDAYEKRYDDNVKRFSMKLFDCSEEAYGIVREQFDLPHPGNVSHWLRASEDQDLDEVGLDLSPNSSENCKTSSGDLEEAQQSGQDSKDYQQKQENGIKVEVTNEYSGNLIPKIEKYSLDELNITMEPVDSCE